MRRAWVVAGAVVVVTAVVIAVALAVNLNRPSQPAGSVSPDQGSSATSSGGDVPTTFPAQQRQPFQAPPELRSENGVLETTFTVQTTTFTVAGARSRASPTMASSSAPPCTYSPVTP